MDADWQPAHPTQCMTPTASGVSLSNDASNGHWARFTELKGKSIHEVLYRLEEDLGAKVWKHASEAHNGSGLELGIPNLDPASKAHAKLIKNGDYKKARAVVLVVNNKVWSNQRLMKAGIDAWKQHASGTSTLMLNTSSMGCSLKTDPTTY